MLAMRASIFAVACVALAALVPGCGSHKGMTGEDATTATLSIGPATSDLMITPTTPATVDYTATLTFPDGKKKDVTADTTFTIDSTFGTFSAATLTLTGAGKTQVFGSWIASDGSQKTAMAEVIGRLTGTRLDPNLPSNFDPGWFSGPEDPSRAPTVVYPPPNVIMPRNIGDFEVHWTDASMNDVFEISLTTEFVSLKVYVPGGNGVAAAGPEPSWMNFLPAEWQTAVGNENAVQFQVRGVNSMNPTSVGSAPPQLVKLSNEAMLGGLYYWASAGSTSPEGIYRHDMSKPGQPAEQYLTKAQTSDRCVACHVLSRDGTEMAVTWDGGNGNSNLLDVATTTLAPEQAGANAWNFGTFTPDGKQFLGVKNGVLTVRDYATQAVLATMSSAGYVTHPDLSADGTKLVYVRPAVTPGSDWAFDQGGIFERTFDEGSLSFGPEQQLFVDGNNNYYPSFSPDGQWILFNHAPAGGSAYNNANASLFVMKADGSAAPIELATANFGAGLTDSWGRWAPFSQTLGANDQQMYWITVSSKRDFGVRLFGVAQPQIWMSAFIPDLAAAGMDPSTPAFRLPFQNIDSNNHIAQWTQQVVAPP